MYNSINNSVYFNADIFKAFYTSYKSNNNWKFRLIDSYIVLNIYLIAIQLVYLILAGNFPKNSFLSGIICCIGTISLTSNIIL